MADGYLWQSPLADMAVAAAADPAEAAVRIEDQPNWLHAGIRVDAKDAAALAAVKETLGMDLPDAAMSSSTSQDAHRHLFWTAPDEWLFSYDDPAFDAVPLLGDALKATFHAVVDLRDSRAVFQISGRAAPDLLAKAVTLDLHRSRFDVGRAALSTFAQTDGLLHCPGRDDSGDRIFTVRVLRSFAAYTWSWLQDAAAEFRQSPAHNIDTYGR